MGFTAIHIETGRRITLRGSERFPMASTYKLPIAVQLLRLCRRRQQNGLTTSFGLDQRFPPRGCSVTGQVFKFGESSLSVRVLLELMLTVSDNTASDLILR